MAENKYEFFKSFKESVADLRTEIQVYYRNKIYNMWMSKYKINGLDEENKEEQENYIFRHFWHLGKLAAWNIKNTDLLGFADFATQTYNMYDFPDTIRLINTRGVSTKIIPEKELVVNKDVVVGWCNPGQTSVEVLANHYINILTEIELVLNTNLKLHNMPFVITCTEKDKKKLNDIVKKIMNNEPVVYASVGDVQKVQVLATQVPYIIDKLTDYKRSVLSDLYTDLGIDNNASSQLEQTHVSVDAVNANNQVINISDDTYKAEIQKFIDKINNVFGRNLTIEPRSVKVQSIHEEEKDINPMENEEVEE